MESIQVINLRSGPWGHVLAFFDVVVDDAVKLNGLMLKQKKDGSGYYYNEPANPRFTNKRKCEECGQRTGDIVTDDNDYKVYDNIFGLALEKFGDGWKVTEKAFEFRTEVTKQAVAAFQRSGEATPAKAGVATTTPDGEDDNDSDLPF